MQMTKLSVRNTDELEDDAERLIETGKLRQAGRVLNQMLENDPNCVAAHFHLARVYRRTRQYDLALKHAHRTLRLNPKERNARLNLGLIYDLKGRDDLAASYYRKELLTNPGSAETLWNIGRLLFRKHKWLQASRYLHRLFESGYSFEIEDTVDKLGYCYHKLNDVSAYVEVFTKYVKLYPSAAWAYANLGRALLHKKDYKGAVLRLAKANQLRPTKQRANELARAKKTLLKSQQTIR